MPEWSEQILRIALPIAAGLATLAFMTGLRRRPKRGRAPATRPKPSTSHGQMARDAAEQIVHEIESRLERLEAVIAIADERIAALRAAEQRAQSIPQPITPPAAHTADAANVAAPPPAKRTRRRTAKGPVEQSVASAYTAEPLTERHARVLELATAGRTSPEIAELLEMPLGEIELTLRLHAFAN